MAELKISYGRVSTDARRIAPRSATRVALGVAAAQIYVDHGLTDTTRD